MSLRVFLVEDLQNTRDLLGELLAVVGNVDVVGHAGTEAEALYWIEQNAGAWDVAVIDLVLEQGSGMGVIARARLANPRGQVVVFSGYASAAVKDHCLSLGAAAVFDKADTEPFVRWLSGAMHG